MSEIDEESIIRMMAGEEPDDSLDIPPPKTKERTKPKGERVKIRDLNSEANDYMDRFFGKTKIEGRHNVYIGSETYNRLSEEVFNIGGRKATLGAYVDCVLQEHFKEYDEVITKIKKDKKR